MSLACPSTICTSQGVKRSTNDTRISRQCKRYRQAQASPPALVLSVNMSVRYTSLHVNLVAIDHHAGAWHRRICLGVLVSWLLSARGRTPTAETSGGAVISRNCISRTPLRSHGASARFDLRNWPKLSTYTPNLSADASFSGCHGGIPLKLTCRCTWRITRESVAIFFDNGSDDYPLDERSESYLNRGSSLRFHLRCVMPHCRSSLPLPPLHSTKLALQTQV
jgi:hypothetical protein